MPLPVRISGTTHPLIQYLSNCHASALFTNGHGFASHFSILFQPIAGEYDLLGKHPNAEQTIRSVPKHETAMEEMKSLVTPELELIESRVLAPAKELQTIMKQIRKTMTKREHKVGVVILVKQSFFVFFFNNP